MLGYSIHVNAMMARWCHSLTSKSNANGEVKDPRALGKFFMENANKGEKKVAKKKGTVNKKRAKSFPIHFTPRLFRDENKPNCFSFASHASNSLDGNPRGEQNSFYL
jgi:hypothetical protein